MFLNLQKYNVAITQQLSWLNLKVVSYYLHAEIAFLLNLFVEELQVEMIGCLLRVSYQVYDFEYVRKKGG